MGDEVYFDGDPATDSTRRRLERILKDEQPRRRWPWIIAGLTAAAAWYLWPRRPAERAAQSAQQDAETRSRG